MPLTRSLGPSFLPTFLPCSRPVSQVWKLGLFGLCQGEGAEVPKELRGVCDPKPWKAKEAGGEGAEKLLGTCGPGSSGRPGSQGPAPLAGSSPD